jgi:DNA topoisomerase VI subunit B
LSLRKAKLWWNAEIQHSLKTAHAWKTKAKQKIFNTNSISSEIKNAANKAVNNLKNQIKMEKSCKKTLEEVDTNDIWAFRK